MISSAFSVRFRTAAVTAVLAVVSATALSPASASARRMTGGRLALAGEAGSNGATVTHPAGRQWASFAYDPPRHELVLFGGNNGNNASAVLGDTWTRANGTWTQQDPAASPSARTGAAMVYDAATDQLLLFGGSSSPGTEGGYNAETWLWTGATWTQLYPAVSPPARHNADMIYDAATHDVILFGGYDGQYLGDTWAWDGTSWTQLHPASSPSPRDSESLVYDQASQTAIMYGGFNSETGRQSDTWAWDGTTWTQLHPATSPGVVTFAWQAAYDAASGQVLLFGGDVGNDNPPLAETWVWDGTTWTQLHPGTSPVRRAYGSMTYNSAVQRVLLFGGSSNRFYSRFPATIVHWTGSDWG